MIDPAALAAAAAPATPAGPGSGAVALTTPAPTDPAADPEAARAEATTQAREQKDAADLAEVDAWALSKVPPTPQHYRDPVPPSGVQAVSPDIIAEAKVVAHATGVTPSEFEKLVSAAYALEQMPPRVSSPAASMKRAEAMEDDLERRHGGDRMVAITHAAVDYIKAVRAINPRQADALRELALVSRPAVELMASITERNARAKRR